MHYRLLLPGLALCCTFAACVSSKVYHAEQSLREQAEAREKVLVQEVMGRRKETADLVKQVGDLNRNLGNQDAEIRELKTELASRTQQMGESSTKLFAEKTALEQDLAAKKAILEKKDAVLQGVSSAQNSRQKILDDLKAEILKSYPASGGVTLEQTDKAVLLTLPDVALFDKNGLAVSSASKTLLAPLANLFATRPELDVEVRAYTDNTLPKGAKNLDDTWDWSLARATNVVRLLIREFNINANQLTPVGKGEFFPVTSNETPEGRQKNRRTVVAVFPSLPKVPAVE